MYLWNSSDMRTFDKNQFLCELQIMIMNKEIILYEQKWNNGVFCFQLMHLGQQPGSPISPQNTTAKLHWTSWWLSLSRSLVVTEIV